MKILRYPKKAEKALRLLIDLMKYEFGYDSKIHKAVVVTTKTDCKHLLDEKSTVGNQPKRLRHGRCHIRAR